MTESLENKTEEQIVHEGEVQTMQVQTKYFKTMSALADYITGFGIKEGTFKYGNLDGVMVYQLEYMKVNS